MTVQQYRPRVFLAVKIKAAATNMIEAVGLLKGSTVGEFHPRGRHMAELRAAVNRASEAVAGWDRAIAEGRSQMTPAEFDALHGEGRS
jgi:hypothetical protein